MSDELQHNDVGDVLDKAEWLSVTGHSLGAGQTVGDMIYASGAGAVGKLVKLAIGTSGQALAVSTAGIPEWVTGLSRGQTLTVASSGAKNLIQADYFCDGVEDQTQIQAALNALPASGGRVVLSEGLFNINSTILVPSNTILEGQGYSTYILLSPASNCHCITNSSTASGNTKLVIKGLHVDCNGDNQTPNTNIRAIGLFKCTESRVLENYCYNSIEADDPSTRGAGIFYQQCSSGLIANNYIENCVHDGISLRYYCKGITVVGNVLYRCGTTASPSRGSGIQVAAGVEGATAAAPCTEITVVGNYMNDCRCGLVIHTTYGEKSGWTDKHYNITYSGNVIDNAADDGIMAIGVINSTISNNTIRNTNATATRGYGVRLHFANGIVVSNNVIYQSPSAGILADDCSAIAINGNFISGSSGRGMSLDGVNRSVISNNILYNNGLAANAVALRFGSASAGTPHSTYNIVEGNQVWCVLENYGIREGDTNQNYNLFKNNQVTGAASANMSLQGTFSEKDLGATNNVVADAYAIDSWIGSSLPIPHYSNVAELIFPMSSAGVSFDPASCMDASDWIGAEGAFQQSNGSSNSTTIVSDTPVFTTDMAYFIVKHASAAAGGAGDATGFSAISSISSSTQANIYNLSGTPFAANYYYWISHAGFVAPVSGYYDVTMRIGYNPIEMATIGPPAVDARLGLRAYKIASGGASVASVAVSYIMASPVSGNLGGMGNRKVLLGTGDRLCIGSNNAGTTKGSYGYIGTSSRSYLSVALIKET